MPTGAIPPPSGGVHRFSLVQERAGFDLGDTPQLCPPSPSSSPPDDAGDSDAETCEKALLHDSPTARDGEEMGWASLLKLSICLGG